MRFHLKSWTPLLIVVYGIAWGCGLAETWVSVCEAEPSLGQTVKDEDVALAYAYERTMPDPAIQLSTVMVEAKKIQHSQEDLVKIMDLYLKTIYKKIETHKYYPDSAKSQEIQGEPVVSFTLNKSGRLLKVQVTQSSGYEVLDEAVKKTICLAEPFESIPDALQKVRLSIKIPVQFTLR